MLTQECKEWLLNAFLVCFALFKNLNYTMNHRCLVQYKITVNGVIVTITTKTLPLIYQLLRCGLRVKSNNALKIPFQDLKIILWEILWC